MSQKFNVILRTIRYKQISNNLWILSNEAQKKAKELKVKAQKEAQLRRGNNVLSLLSNPNTEADLDVTDLDVHFSLFELTAYKNGT
uniref:Uncharacterized protein n=1 Tax=Brugia malayi TaxID=6279 RepID=A8PC15_BRUMA